MPNNKRRKPALFIRQYSSADKAPKRILQSRFILRLYPRSIIPLQKSLNHSPAGNVPESSIISFTPYFSINSPISSRTLFTERLRNLLYKVGQEQKLHFPHQQSRPDIM